MTGIRKFSLAMAVVAGLLAVVATGEPVRAEDLTVGAVHSLKAAFRRSCRCSRRNMVRRCTSCTVRRKRSVRQIEKGAPIDVFLPEAVEEVEKLQKKGLTLNGGPRIYAQTSLVLVMAAASPATSISFHDVFPESSSPHRPRRS